MPALQSIDLGPAVGAPAYHNEATTGRTRNGIVIRAALTPELAGGFIVSCCLTKSQAKRMRKHPLLAELLPQAQFLGDI